MLLRVVMSGFGVKIPKRKIGLSLPSGVYIQTKVNMNAPHDLYGLVQFRPQFDGHSGAEYILGYVYTNWISMTSDSASLKQSTALRYA